VTEPSLTLDQWIEDLQAARDDEKKRRDAGWFTTDDFRVKLKLAGLASSKARAWWMLLQKVEKGQAERADGYATSRGGHLVKIVWFRLKKK